MCADRPVSLAVRERRGPARGGARRTSLPAAARRAPRAAAPARARRTRAARHIPSAHSRRPLAGTPSCFARYSRVCVTYTDVV